MQQQEEGSVGNGLRSHFGFGRSRGNLEEGLGSVPGGNAAWQKGAGVMQRLALALSHLIHNIQHHTNPTACECF